MSSPDATHRISAGRSEQDVTSMATSPHQYTECDSAQPACASCLVHSVHLDHHRQVNLYTHSIQSLGIYYFFYI